MKYCQRCVYPDTKPDLFIDEDGICSACRAYENREDIDWDERKRAFLQLVYGYCGDGDYDCLIPVSGGKDSTYQVIKILECGLNPLCVTATTDSLSDIGRRNIENIKSLGVDYIEVTPNPVVGRKLNKLTLEQIGDISYAEHVRIFTVPVRMAVNLRIRLIVWGENPQNEYGGPASAQGVAVLTRSWLEEFGGLLGLRVSDLYSQGFSKQDLIQYTYPADGDLTEVGVRGIFLGYYFPWDGLGNALTAKSHGFEFSSLPVEGSGFIYENLDNFQTGIHDFFKFLKFGFGRATDIACNHVRRGRYTREEALDHVRRYDGAFPDTYLGKPLEDILSEIDMTVAEFMGRCAQFRNKKIIDEFFNLREPPC